MAWWLPRALIGWGKLVFTGEGNTGPGQRPGHFGFLEEGMLACSGPQNNLFLGLFLF